MEKKENNTSTLTMLSDYSKDTRGAKDVIDVHVLPLLLAALERMDLRDYSCPVFTVADFGCADGGTSLDAVCRVLKELRAHLLSKHVPIQMVYTDLPSNDFCQVFKHANTLAAEIANVSVLACGTPFHKQCLPRDTLSLGFSATAFHWLQKQPCNITNHVHMVGAKGEERQAYIEQGKKDWAALLAARAQELVPGGRMVIAIFCIDADGRYLGNTEGGVNMFDNFARLWRGIVTSNEFERTNFPQCYHTVDDLCAPLRNCPGSENGRGLGLHLDDCQTHVVKCPYAATFEKTGDAQKFSREYVPTLRSWSETTFRSGLSAERSDAEKQAIVDTFFESYRKEVEARPNEHRVDYVHCYLTIRKAE